MTADTPEPPPRRKWHLQRWLFALLAAMLAYGAWTEYAFRSALKRAKALGWEVVYTDPVEEIRANWKNAFKKETWLDGVTFVRILTGETLEQHRAILPRLNPRQISIRDGHGLHDRSPLEGLTRLIALEIREAIDLINVDGLKNFTTLQQIFLEDCTTLANVDGLKGLTALTNVTINSSNLLTNVDGLKNLTSLESADFSGCTALTNWDAFKGLTALEQVSLHDCTGLRNVDGLKNLSALKYIWLNGCTGLTNESITALMAALPNIQIHSDYYSPADEPEEQ